MADPSALAGLRVLVVEDELMVSLLIEDTLADEQCVVVGPFDTVQSALSAVRTQQIDAAILDVNLAGVRVYPVAEILDARNIPFLLLSGYGQGAGPQDRPYWRACNKPFRPAELVSQLVERIVASRGDK